MTAPENILGLLLADDCRADAALIKRALDTGLVGYRLHLAETLEAAKDVIMHNQPDVVLADLALPPCEPDEAAVVTELRRATFVPLIVISGRLTADIIRRCVRSGADAVLRKDFLLTDPTRLSDAMIASVERRYRDVIEPATERKELLNLTASDLRATRERLDRAVLELHKGTPVANGRAS